LTWVKQDEGPLKRLPARWRDRLRVGVVVLRTAPDRLAQHYEFGMHADDLV